jgi:hypothetical protein
MPERGGSSRFGPCRGSGSRSESSHPGLAGAERVLDSLSPHPHGLGHAVEAVLHPVEHVLILPAFDDPPLGRRAPGSERTGEAGAQMSVAVEVFRVILVEEYCSSGPAWRARRSEMSARPMSRHRIAQDFQRSAFLHNLGGNLPLAKRQSARAMSGALGCDNRHRCARSPGAVRTSV